MKSMGKSACISTQHSTASVNTAWNYLCAWWRHQKEIFSALLAICAGNSPVTGEFSAQRPVTRSFDFFFDLRLNKRLDKHWWGWWFQAPSRSLWRHSNGVCVCVCVWGGGGEGGGGSVCVTNETTGLSFIHNIYVSWRSIIHYGILHRAEQHTCRFLCQIP